MGAAGSTAAPLLEVLLRRKEAPLMLAAAGGQPDPATAGFVAELGELSLRSPLSVALWRAAAGADSPPALRARLRPSLLAAYLHSTASDPCHHHWLTGEAEKEEEQQQQQQQQTGVQQVNRRLYSAELTHVVTADLWDPEAESLLDSVAIGRVAQRCQQMATLRRLLWTNGADLADARFCPRRCHRALGPELLATVLGGAARRRPAPWRRHLHAQ
ncbi:uncharacterized protein LOC119103028 [Pollicipes pollicipes]|uniref:uncharacterized protein LOC119103028 n=1 Tax=Pollicipes pollicipes TaxID=41117 RepID=UPI001884FC19|nr:uncharacterized protein LOC119103028 [Pollicipes pollicipes]